MQRIDVCCVIFKQNGNLDLSMIQTYSVSKVKKQRANDLSNSMRKIHKNQYKARALKLKHDKEMSKSS